MAYGLAPLIPAYPLPAGGTSGGMDRRRSLCPSFAHQQTATTLPSPRQGGPPYTLTPNVYTTLDEVDLFADALEEMARAT
jgi:hypothetical protein